MPNKILIVDDDNEIRKIIGIYLENEGYQVLKAENGEQALTILTESNKSEYIEKYNLDKIFDKFYRVDISRSNNIEGSGLGLAISKRIIELHNWQIWAECDGDMMTINIKLPVNLKNE